MRLQRLSVSLFGVVAAISLVLAAATIWLFLTEPVTVATAVNEGDDLAARPRARPGPSDRAQRTAEIPVS